jgi:hypothetical protein
MPPQDISLQSVLARTDDWLRFAEAKNGVLLALNCAIAVGLLQVVGTLESPSRWISLAAAHSLILLFAAITLGAASFVPRLTPPWFTTFPRRPAQTNILYFGDICTHNAQSYLVDFYDCLDVQGAFSKLDSQYAGQIVTNSKIAYIKYAQFNITAFFTLSALLTPAGAALYYRVKT